RLRDAVHQRVDLVPALRMHTAKADALVDSIAQSCLDNHGEGPIPPEAAEAIIAVSRVLDIGWIPEALQKPARIICPRSTHCPRQEPCDGHRSRAREITDVRQEIIRRVKRA
ncbi:MAG: DUF3612 domain-containing protein, partial [Comamonadaceae bacterium]